MRVQVPIERAQVPAAVQSSPLPTRPARLDSVDLLRGLVMVIMALDHTRGFFGHPRPSPTDLENTTVALFLTRWITHFCAPVFVFLAGTGVFLSASRGKSNKELAWSLVTRGLWIVFLDLTIVRFGWVFSLDYHDVGVGVLWAIGWSMLVLAGLIFLPVTLVAILSIVMIAAHNAFDNIHANDLGSFRWLWAILHGGLPPGEAMEPFPGYRFYAGYPLVPWIGVLALGYAFGSLLLLDRDRRRPILLGLGVSASLLFFIIRGGNFYGDLHPWVQQKNAVFTFLSILNCHKYPPSLSYLLMTLGPAIGFLGVIDRPQGPAGRFFVIFGRVPMFYYLLHIPFIHALAIGFNFIRYGPAIWQFRHSHEELPNDFGYDLWVVYLVWISVVLALYPLCRWFADVKRRRNDVWLSYV